MSVLDKSHGITIMNDRKKFLEDSIERFNKLRDLDAAEMRRLQNNVNGYKSTIDDMVEELTIIKENWNILIRSSDPLSKTQLIFRRCGRRCPICNEMVFSKKMLKVHKFEKHGY